MGSDAIAVVILLITLINIFNTRGCVYNSSGECKYIYKTIMSTMYIAFVSSSTLS